MSIAEVRKRLLGGTEALLTGVPDGMDAYAIGQYVLDRDGGAEANADGSGPPVHLHVLRDDRRAEAFLAGLKFFHPDIATIEFPAWDTVPYDRVSPNPDLIARRISALARLAAAKRKAPTIVLTTVNAVLQRTVTPAFIKGAIKTLAPGQRVDMKRLASRLTASGYNQTGTVMEAGEFAVRGGILDLFPPGRSKPLRLDFFGDTLESMKQFDPETQRTSKQVARLVLLPTSEFVLTDASRQKFRSRYVETYGPATTEDTLYEAVSAGQRFSGVEHWLPFFHDEMATLLDYIPEASLSFDYLADEAIDGRIEQVSEHFAARVDAMEQATFGAAPYNPLPVLELYIEEAEWKKTIAARDRLTLTPFDQPEDGTATQIVPLDGKAARNFAAERSAEGGNVFAAAVEHVNTLVAGGRTVAVLAWSAGARERLAKLFVDNGMKKTAIVETWADVQALAKDTVGFGVLGLEQGFVTPQMAIVAEQDILGDRLVRPRKASRKATDVLTEAASLTPGDLVVHADHGIGRFVGLKTIDALGAPHDCLELEYHGGDRLFLPVENIEMLSRYGSDAAGAQLDRLGGAAWQARKSRLKARLRDIADQLIKIAALRALKTAEPLTVTDDIYDAFLARFPFEATEDQEAAANAVLEDLGSGSPLDRLVCGDVGFGKTEVALRAAFVAVMGGKQVAVVVPTTLLARQHYRTFVERFEGYPVRIAQASRLVGTKELAENKAGLKSGQVDIIVGTHALLGKSVEFSNLGLLIIDEEQHFGVQHKERLKQLRDDVHVLTLTATPIPRTLQLALSGVRELSLITTPPVDRLAVRTYVSPFDPVVLRDALLREKYRNGQAFYVVPRISDLDEIANFLRETVPEIKFTIAHGQMAPGQLDDIMNAFYDGEYDVLLSTTIVESGLDIPRANTLIVHRADRFGLSQLYQLRGRVGRSKTRAYAYFTVPPKKKMTEGAEKRLKVLQSLDTLGAGFSLASHDLDIRGAGNLLGEEQSGHIKEVGFELYQSMLEETIAALKDGTGGAEMDETWSPVIQLGASILIPESYVEDLQLRLGLYRRLSNLTEREDIEAFAAELVDRFGPLPEEVAHLLEVVEIKAFCRKAGIAQIDAGPKGGVVRFRNDTFVNPQGLAKFVSERAQTVKIQPDHKLVYRADWDLPEKRLKGVRSLSRQLSVIAGEAQLQSTKV
ncbi:MAG: transcription-repair coupling factor [Pseudomonadota bacterium]